MLIETYAKEEAETIVRVVDEGFGKGLTEREGGFEDVVEVAGDGGVGEGRGEERGQEGVFSGGVVNKGEVEVAEGEFHVVGLFVFFGEKRGECGLAGGFEKIDSPT